MGANVPHTIPQRLGRSWDGRAGRWRITCPCCTKQFEPPTTMFATQELRCPSTRCGAEILASYNTGRVDLLRLSGAQ